MGVKDIYSVRTIQKWECREWLLGKHYAHRIPSISYAFGLYQDMELIGVLTIGKPASPSLCIGVCGRQYSEFVYELNRLCIIDEHERNVASYFVGNALKQISADLIIVSYADTAYGHHGYIYQATNWIYTGATVERTDIGGDEGTHSRHYNKSADYSQNRRIRSSKHRYIYFIGKRKKEFRKALKYDVLPYPKGDNQRYDASYEPEVQGILF